LRALTKKSFSLKQKKAILQKGGYLGSLLAPIASVVAPLLYIVSVKELTLINRYHQTQERPKPPVEQRVKVMDTLNKKKQTIREREDMSADERL
jgi:hypothetical protein